jgi:2-polyprenyl-6-methoxyphenol hydroxylase-like FAD-dependent oxidoreductase
MTDTRARVVIVGASAAGLTAAETLRRSGHTGTITLIDNEPTAPTTARPYRWRDTGHVDSRTWRPGVIV